MAARSGDHARLGGMAKRMDRVRERCLLPYQARGRQTATATMILFCSALENRALRQALHKVLQDDILQTPPEKNKNHHVGIHRV